MTNKQLQQELAKFPDDLEVAFLNWDYHEEEISSVSYNEQASDKLVLTDRS